MTVPSAPLKKHQLGNYHENFKETYEGQRAYGKEAGPCSAGIGLGGEPAQYK